MKKLLLILFFITSSFSKEVSYETNELKIEGLVEKKLVLNIDKLKEINDLRTGFVNLSEAIANKENIGGFIKVDKKYYTPIQIVAAKLDSCDESCEKFANFLTTKIAKDIFEKYGL